MKSMLDLSAPNRDYDLKTMVTSHIYEYLSKFVPKQLELMPTKSDLVVSEAEASEETPAQSFSSKIGAHISKVSSDLK